MLERGGNAVDAIVAAAFTGFVVQPASCGIGGYGHLALYLAERREFIAVDHFVRAPAAARDDMFRPDESAAETYYGWPRVAGRLNEHGRLAPAVPGAVAGLCAAHERFGALPLPEVLQPAIAAADAGVPVTWDLVLVIAERLEVIRGLPHTASFLLRNGNPPQAASVQERRGSAGLLGPGQDVAPHRPRGPRGFYTGPVAEAIEPRVEAQHCGYKSGARDRPKDPTQSPPRDQPVFVTGPDECSEVDEWNVR